MIQIYMHVLIYIQKKKIQYIGMLRDKLPVGQITAECLHNTHAQKQTHTILCHLKWRWCAIECLIYEIAILFEQFAKC